MTILGKHTVAEIRDLARTIEFRINAVSRCAVAAATVGGGVCRSCDRGRVRHLARVEMVEG